MHNVLQKLIEIFKTVGADELHNTQIYNTLKPKNEIDSGKKKGIVEQAILIKTGNLHPDPNRFSKEAKPGQGKARSSNKAKIRLDYLFLMSQADCVL